MDAMAIHTALLQLHRSAMLKPESIAGARPVNYVVKIQTADRTDTYTDLTGSAETARRAGLHRFQQAHPDSVVVDSFVMPQQDYFGGHDCRDDDGDGCCSVCGGVIAGTWLDKQTNGGD